MFDAPPPGVNHTPKGIRASLKRQIRAGDELAFSVVDDDGTKRASHTLRFDRGRYRIRSAETGEEIEDGFATMAAAQRAGFAASREKLGHIL